MNEEVGFIGLGSMGLPIASNLLAGGFKLRVWNRTAAKAAPLTTRGAIAATQAAEVAVSGGIVVTMLADDDAVESVVIGERGLAAQLGAGGVHISMSTIAPATASRLAQIHLEAGNIYVGAPVFGRPENAELRQLVVCTSGPERAKARIRPILEAVGRAIFDFGEEPGAANVAKLCGNFLLGAAIEAMAEAFTLAQKHGVTRRQTYEFFTQTLFDCFVYRGYGELIASEHYQPVGAKPSLIRKDYGLILDAAAEELVPMPLANLIHERLTATVAKGREDVDWAGFAREVSESAGL